ncbi:acyclic terpene utilization AtuA family protein [Elioraea tepidiphila]|uniref:acyclic terpene utilization AtuA family protein n=1 Tax=Elioraea tepidiphila TaxID=457934 RepID=UPI00037AFD61|nr:acyclic terpene utilization AtuA family protein [Elioraea tepidiphila]
MTEVSILCPTGHLGFTPLEKDSFLAGCELKPDFVIADSGSCDIGPYPLGADGQASPAAWQRHDLEIMLTAARRLGVPMIVGSASDTGTDRGVEQFAALIREIAAEHGLAPFRMATIKSEQTREAMTARLAAGVPITGLDGRADADAAVLARTDRIVAVMGAEPIAAALREGAEVVIAGRASDCALFAAPLLNAGMSPATAYYAGKLMECASFCCEPFMGKESILGRIRENDIRVRAMHPGQRCTPASLASHAMYERRDPFREYVASGYVDMSHCRYEPVDEKTTRASGAVFVPSAQPMVKLEGAGKVGERRLAVVGIRDPYTIENIDKAIAWARARLAERFGAPEQAGWQVFYHVYGRNGVMGDLEPTPPARAHELGIVVETVCQDGKRGEEICALAARNLFYARLAEVKGTAGAAALMADEVLVGKPGYEWTLNHIIPVKDPSELFRTAFHTVDGSARKAA